MDLIISVLIIMLLIGIVTILMSNVIDLKKPKAIYGSQIFTNLGHIDNDKSFLTNYIIDENKLTNFCDQSYEDSKAQVLNNTGLFNQYSNDYCMFFLDKATTVEFECNSADVDFFGHNNCDLNHPCGNTPTNQSFVHVKPVLKFDSGINKIVNMYIVICE